MEDIKDKTENSYNSDLTTDDILNEEPNPENNEGKDDEDEDDEDDKKDGKKEGEDLEESYTKDGNSILNE